MRADGADNITVDSGVVFQMNSWAKGSVLFVSKAMDAMNMNFAGQYLNHITSPSTSYFVSSPYQRGLVAAFLSSTSRKGRLSVEEAEWSIVGEQDYGWFGYSLHNHIFKNQTLLLVGSPTWSTCKSVKNCHTPSRGTQSVGKAYGFYPPEKDVTFVVHGDTVSITFCFSGAFCGIDMVVK
ncbi:hypothetical protein XELAEV_18031727mg [Xenopus laevis]|uniref:Uncharacterized protein n=1 Tax=Xenopus laevis TaxID=8355 RepID=A0A974CNA5_XENLA|nr:hypothetical protein XELAEV_18031727mg [Xenopus laevis]